MLNERALTSLIAIIDVIRISKCQLKNVAKIDELSQTVTAIDTSRIRFTMMQKTHSKFRFFITMQSFDE